MLDSEAGSILKKNDAPGSLPIASSTTQLLIIAFQVARNIKMDNRTHIWLGNTHAESDSSHQHRNITTNKALLILNPFCTAHTCMIGQSLNTIIRQKMAQFLDVRTGLAINDYWCPRLL